MKQALFALLLLCGTAYGQAPSAVVKVDPPGPVKPGTFVTIDASESVGQIVDFDTDVPDSIYRRDSNGKVIYFNTGAAGLYPFKLEALSVVDGVLRRSKSKVVIPVEGATPAPPPNPSPNPGPDDTPSPGPVNPLPAVYAGPLIVTFVYDPAAMTPQLASLKDSIAIPAAFKSLDARYVTLATTVNGQPSPEYTRRGLAPIVGQLGGLPALIFQDPSGKVIHKVAAPADESGVVAAVNQLRGAK